MGRGLSDQQRDILEVLPWHSKVLEDKTLEAPSTRKVIDLLGIARTECNRVSISRALSRLHQRKLIIQGSTNTTNGPHHSGWVRATADDVAAFQKAQVKELVDEMTFRRLRKDIDPEYADDDDTDFVHFYVTADGCAHDTNP